jgi:hypothetical protein
VIIHTPSLPAAPPPATGSPAAIWREAEDRRSALLAELYAAEFAADRAALLLQLANQSLLQATVYTAAFGSDRPHLGQALWRETALLDLLADAEFARSAGTERVRRVGDQIGDLIEHAGGAILDVLAVEDNDQARRDLLDDLQAALTPAIGEHAALILTLIAPLTPSEVYGPDEDGTDDADDDWGLAVEVADQPMRYWPTETCAERVCGEVALYAPNPPYPTVHLDVVAEPDDSDSGIDWQPFTHPQAGSPLVWEPPAPAQRWLTLRRYQRLRRARITAIVTSIGTAMATTVAALRPHTLRSFHGSFRHLHLQLGPAAVVQATLAVAAVMTLSSLAEAVHAHFTFQAPTWNPRDWAIGQRWYRPGRLVHHLGELAVTAGWMHQIEHGDRIWVFILTFDPEALPHEELAPDGRWVPIEHLAPIES